MKAFRLSPNTPLNDIHPGEGAEDSDGKYSLFSRRLTHSQDAVQGLLVLTPEDARPACPCSFAGGHKTRNRGRS